MVGYDFMRDQAEAILQEMVEGGLSTASLINDYWQADDLREKWLTVTHDLGAINAHFSHREAVPAETAGGLVTAEELTSRGGVLDFSIGCHAGLNVPDSQASDQDFDFPQAQAGRGMSWIANTGFGYGDRDEIAYSEQLTLSFVRRLREGASVGDALRQAKADYVGRTGVHAFTPYDEKVVSELVLYGLPMLRLEFPASSHPRLVQSQRLNQSTDSTGLTAQRATFDLPVASRTITHGTYFHVDGEVEVVAGMPIMPRTSVSVTLSDQAASGEHAHGAFFEGGSYSTHAPFDPVIARLVTDTAVSEMAEPIYEFAEWMPAAWDLVNSLRMPDGLQQRLVIVPAQYSAASSVTGTMRVFDTLTYTVYYSDSEDIWPPSFWRVEDEVIGSERVITVEVTDRSGVARVAVGYTWGEGEWHMAELSATELSGTIGDPDLWIGTLRSQPYTGTLSYFVQAVDRAGNVGVATNKARYFPDRDVIGVDGRVYLPLVLKGLGQPAMLSR